MKKKAISILLGLCIMSLAGCGAVATGTETVSNRMPVQAVELADHSGQTDDQDTDQDNQTDEARTGSQEDGYTGSGRETKDEKDSQIKEDEMKPAASEEEIETHIYNAGKAYDGIVSYDTLTVDSIML